MTKIKPGKLYITINATAANDYKTFRLIYIQPNTICLLLSQIPYDTDRAVYLFLTNNKIIRYANLIDYFGNNFNDLNYHL